MRQLQLSSSCPFCGKSFLKTEVTRRHVKACAKKHDQPIPEAGKAGRKRQSCDSCFEAKAACDKNLPCSRCTSLGRPCTFAAQPSPSPGSTCSAAASSPSPSTTPQPSARQGGAFSFLRHFASPYVQKDRLAIGETGKNSTPRNLATLYSHIEDALIPSNPLSAFLGFGDYPSNPLGGEEGFLSDYLSDALFPSNLSNQLTEITSELVETSKSMGIRSENPELDIMHLTTVFGVSNMSSFISVFFHAFHWHLPIVHSPSFDPVMDDTTTSSSWIIDVAEEFIFRQVLHLLTVSSPMDPANLLSTVQTLQSALIIEMLQFARDDLGTRRRIRIIRHPCLVSTVRSLGIFHLKRSAIPLSCDDVTWKNLVAEEMCLRIASWAFLADGFLTVCLKNHPAIPIFEMDCNFPWSADLWEAESASAFSKIAATHSTELPLPSLRGVATQLLEIPKTAPISWSLSISAEHLLILIYAINSLAFQTRAGLLPYLSVDRISLAAENWKRIWDSVIGSFDDDQYLHLGYPKHAEELWWLLKATLDVTEQRGVNFRYLDSAATDDMGSLNEFIQWCHCNFS
ncbi:uncharacterized protein N7477_005185 [Penicillium maclennaniae]|uniref:uncharacterized protein n=1 Tax=Penicillium maclennaniae TaxID=1343394 RepID=UPI00253F80FD|nr:uncharacterized protein N7477_005185 [Penicillium maclennaniae]KAJ5675251.1 hypothetical protein N7477_005185 [Penicillium maclennaniae]